GFNIYRKKYLEDLFPEEPLASVSEDEFNYSDESALPTINYYYAVTAILEGDAQSPYSNIEEGWVSTGFITNEISVYHGTTPIIDGIISEGEWDDAFLIDNSDFLGTYDNTIVPVGSVMGYYKSNDANTELYVAYIDYNDDILVDHDEVALYIDDNNDGSFPPPEDLSEGNYWAAHYASGDVIKYRPIFNTGGVGDVIYLDDPQIAVSNSAGYVVYEFVIPIGSEYFELNPGPEGKSSLAVFVLDDPSAFDGWWPYNNQNLFAPTGFGTMSLNAVNEIPPAPENLCASIIESTAIIEWSMPEINDFDYFNIYSEFNREFSLLGSTVGTQFLYDLPEFGVYQFYVTTVDNSGQESDPSETVEIEYGGAINQDILLHEGFQFISSYIIAPDPDMMVVMADVINDNLDFARNSLGQTLRKIGPNWVNGIGDWIIDEGYLVKMNADDSFTIEGIRVNSSTAIPVAAGFKFVSYFPENAMNALEAFATIIGDDLDFIRDSEGTMIRKIGPNWVNGIGDAMPGEGYLVKMFADGEIIYPAAAKSSGLNKVKPSHLIFEGGNAAEAVYTIYVDGLEIGDEVAAFDGEIMVGTVKISSENVYENELPVFSTLTSGVGYEVGNPIILKVWSENTILPADFTMEAVYDSYVSDVYPDNDGEYSVVNITKAARLSEDLLVYPNPATNMIFISSSNQISNIVIFNCFGQSVYEGKSMQIKTENFESGVYVIRIETDNGIETSKFTVK
ncbi:MAG: T9SS type A sorting domain-containing protein, partial [Bacteroidales bacterium]|nr:T9SS type A sorting domain-containing protein [Bacteroidales bacterium]